MKKFFCFLSCLIIVGFEGLSTLVYAAEIGDLTTTTSTLIDDNPNVTVIDDDTVLVEYPDEQLNDTIERIDDYTIKISNEDENIIINFDDMGNAYIDGVLVSEVTVEENIENQGVIKENSGISTRGMNGPWTVKTTQKIKRSFYVSAFSIALGIIGFCPGFGTLAGISGIALEIWNLGQRELYYKVTTYIDNSYTWSKQSCYVYKKSNYTGLLKSYHGRATRIHW